MTDEQWVVYAAGFLDGEGSVYPNTGRQFGKGGMVSVKVSQRYEDPLERFMERWGGGMGLDGPCYYWLLQRRADVKAFLIDVQPFVIVKARQVALALRFLSIEPEGGRQGYYSKEQVRLRKAILDKMSRINREKLGVR